MIGEVFVLVTGEPHNKELDQLRDALRAAGCSGKIEVRKCSGTAIAKARRAVEEASNTEDRSRHTAWR